MKHIFSLKLSQQQNIDTVNSFQVASDKLLLSTKTVLQNHNFRTEENGNGINFIYPIGFTTHSGDNERAGMRILRKGRIEFLELPNHRIEIKSITSLEHLAFIAVGVGLTLFFAGLFIPEIKINYKLIIASLILIGLIFGIGRKSIKNRIANILTNIVKN
ncbi:hypothetical protein [Zobellia nedashkovskayae]|uniref:hypothetical protein n=1 Tax=Zobellia nedashkovskayae TaxID=2779510 RepID=UPI00188D7290|nr:hypothetical protein [Zobellia nedashkovskayae]